MKDISIRQSRTVNPQSSVVSTKIKASAESTSDLVDELVPSSNRSVTGWELVRLVGYFPGGIAQAGLRAPDGARIKKNSFETGNPFWIYELKNAAGETQYAGPDDARRVMPDFERRLQNLEKAHRQNLGGLKNVLSYLHRALVWLGEDQKEAANLLEASDKLGDQHRSLIELGRARAATFWRERMLGELENFEQAIEGLQAVAHFSRSLNALSEPERLDLKVKLSGMNEGVLLPERAQGLLSLHRRLLSLQNAMARESLSWGNQRAQAVSFDYEAKTPAFHCDLWAIQWLFEQPGSQGLEILDLGTNTGIGFRTANRLFGAEAARRFTDV